MSKVAISFLLAAVASLALLVFPIYTQRSTWWPPLHGGHELQVQPDYQPPTNQVRRKGLASVDHLKGYLILAIPVIIAGVPFLLNIRTARIVSAVLLLGWVAVGLASIGLFYLPSLAMMIWAGASGKSS